MQPEAKRCNDCDTVSLSLQLEIVKLHTKEEQGNRTQKCIDSNCGKKLKWALSQSCGSYIIVLECSVMIGFFWMIQTRCARRTCITNPFRLDNVVPLIRAQIFHRNIIVTKGASSGLRGFLQDSFIHRSKWHVETGNQDVDEIAIGTSTGEQSARTQHSCQESTFTYRSDGA